MSEKSKRKRRKRKHETTNPLPNSFMWQDDNGEVHSLIPGLPPTPEKLDEMTKVYQENIQKSPLWDIMVKQFGPEKAEELLKECRVEVR